MGRVDQSLIEQSAGSELVTCRCQAGGEACQCRAKVLELEEQGKEAIVLKVVYDDEDETPQSGE